MNQNESPFDVDAALKDEILDEMRAIPFNRYPDDQPTVLIEALARSVGCSPDMILVGNGSNELTHTLGLSLVTGESCVVLPRPMFALFETVVQLFGGQVVSVPPRRDLSFDAEGIVSAVERHDPVLTIVATPNNPTGLEISGGELLAIVRAARGFVLVDEAYVEFGAEPHAVSLIAEFPNVIVMRTLSKGFGLAGLRIGFLVAHSEVIGEFLKARLPFMIGELAQKTAVKVLEQPSMIASRVRMMRESTAWLSRELDALSLERLPSRANFVVFRSPLPPHVLLERMADAGVLIRDMSGYPELKGYVRVSAGTTVENKAFLIALKSALS